MKLNILIVDDNEDLLLAARLFLKQHFSLVHTEQNPEKLPVLLMLDRAGVVTPEPVDQHAGSVTPDQHGAAVHRVDEGAATVHRQDRAMHII